MFQIQTSTAIGGRLGYAIYVIRCELRVQFSASCFSLTSASGIRAMQSSMPPRAIRVVEHPSQQPYGQ